MEISHGLLLLLFNLSLLLLAELVNGSTDTQRKPYIVYMGDLPKTGAVTAADHHSLLSAVVGSDRMARDSTIHSYGRSFNGFAARLLPHEAKILSEKEGVVSVFPNTMRKLHTTRSWDFLGMREKMKKRNPKAEINMVIGLLDTGIWMDCPSFKDKGYGPPPTKWKGKCSNSSGFTGCNNKVIGAKYYDLDHQPGMLGKDDILSPVDTDGHGTHTASTAAGIVVKNASLFGVGKGTARGGVPLARIAMYKVCWYTGCSDMNLLAGFDDAIADGVDVLSVSIGGTVGPFFEDPIAIGAFHAMRRGVLVSSSAGNDGPLEATVQNVAPWILTVGATGLDREFRSQVKLGNGMKASGVSVNTFSPRKKMYPLTSGTLASNSSGAYWGNVSACDWASLIPEEVKGKIVYCMGNRGQDFNIRDLGGIGTIMSLDEPTDIGFTFVIPSTFVTSEEGRKIDKYINSTKKAQAVIYKSKAFKIAAPFVSSFSSRGPQDLSPNILKPDIVAPGLDILAGYSKLAPISGDPEDRRFANFNILTGTSMSCPHVAAAAAYVKSFHPKWSPAAIKSALMTTATTLKIKDNALGSGSGQLNPRIAVHPGLVYDIPTSGYIRFLCKEGYNSTTIGLLTGGKQKYKCSNFRPALGSDGLNYPSMHLQIKDPTARFSAVFYRTVTSVGHGASVYKATVKATKGLSVRVVPNTLSFQKAHQRRSFKIVLKGKPNNSRIQSAFLEWSDSKHKVKSPILVYRQSI
ncbi:hypothetical protein VitviT2T_012569 [Vitis vinifera]|uniref:Subtilisin-like protease SBT4.15 n=1 Tax=Vitis vinifera TaxID=29760 RepID=A0ABY9CE60_VITVI|nr:subtilisin-like protease SBT4.15 [Vitis vinifera]WJZ93645.1 hypothetical protein VitviT2T_012569 [Vitis vinifera]|eukprot:XP_002277106.1 PREDICTED: subtilisin-like protease SBT4.15 [Vitis vinifera]